MLMNLLALSFKYGCTLLTLSCNKVNSHTVVLGLMKEVKIYGKLILDFRPEIGFLHPKSTGDGCQK